MGWDAQRDSVGRTWGKGKKKLQIDSWKLTFLCYQKLKGTRGKLKAQAGKERPAFFFFGGGGGVVVYYTVRVYGRMGAKLEGSHK